MTRNFKKSIMIIGLFCGTDNIQTMHVAHQEFKPEQKNTTNPSENNIDTISTNNPPAPLMSFSGANSFNTLGIKPFSLSNNSFVFKNPKFQTIKEQVNRSNSQNESDLYLEKTTDISDTPFEVNDDPKKIVANNESLNVQAKRLDVPDITIKNNESQEEEDLFFDTNQGPENAFAPKDDGFFDTNLGQDNAFKQATLTPDYRAKIRNNNSGPFQYKNEYFGYDRAADLGYSKYQTIILKNGNPKVPEQLKERKFKRNEVPLDIANYYKKYRTITPEQCRDYYFMQAKTAKNNYRRQAMQ
jgi:hypothetical protein